MLCENDFFFGVYIVIAFGLIFLTYYLKDSTKQTGIEPLKDRVSETTSDSELIYPTNNNILDEVDEFLDSLGCNTQRFDFEYYSKLAPPETDTVFDIVKYDSVYCKKLYQLSTGEICQLLPETERNEYLFNKKSYINTYPYFLRNVTRLSNGVTKVGILSVFFTCCDNVDFGEQWSFFDSTGKFIDTKTVSYYGDYHAEYEIKTRKLTPNTWIEQSIHTNYYEISEPVDFIFKMEKGKKKKYARMAQDTVKIFYKLNQSGAIVQTKKDSIRHLIEIPIE